MTRLRKLWLHVRLLWSGVCPKHGKVIEFLDSGCEVCQHESLHRRARGAATQLVELRAINGGQRG
jgi:hypothetical protein